MFRSRRYQSVAAQVEEQTLLLKSIGNEVIIATRRLDRLRWVAEEAARLLDAEGAERQAAANNLQTALDNLLPGDVPAWDSTRKL